VRGRLQHHQKLLAFVLNSCCLILFLWAAAMLGSVGACVGLWQQACWPQACFTGHVAVAHAVIAGHVLMVLTSTLQVHWELRCCYQPHNQQRLWLCSRRAELTIINSCRELCADLLNIW